MRTLVISDHRAFYGTFARSAPAPAEPWYLLEKGERTPYPEMEDRVVRGEPDRPETWVGLDPAVEYAAVVAVQGKEKSERVLRTLRQQLPNIWILFLGTVESLPDVPADAHNVIVRRWRDVIGERLADEVRRLFTAQRVHEVREICAAAQGMAILLQHDPDPDAIASGLGLRNLVGRNRSTAPMVTFGGVTRPENREMLRVLDLTVESIRPDDLAGYDLVACVDVQPSYFGDLLARDVAIVIDHHPEQPGYRARYRDIRASYGATATLVTEYMRAAGVEPNQKQATALLYGLKSDTLFLGRECIPADIEAFYYLYSRANLSWVRRIERPQIPLEALRTFGGALQDLAVEQGLAFAFLGTLEREDVIPQIADLLLQAEGAEWSVAAGIVEGRVIASVRNAGFQKSAGSVLKRVFGAIGSAGGHRSMAKAVIPLDRWEATYGGADERTIRKVFASDFLVEATTPAAAVADGP